MRKALRVGLAAAAGAAVLVAVGLTGCSTAGYYWQSLSGHLAMMNAAKPVQEWLDDGSTPERLKEKLALSQRIRQYAVAQLKLPENASYHRYADLHRKAVVWNVVAAPEFSLTLKKWCFPVTGCVGYRGYFDEIKARKESEGLAGEGWESSYYPVPAYSTLGWMNWAGGDPLLNTFINYPEGELARLIFHELAHQVVYAPGDTMFNESFATAVERLGVQRWLATQASEQAREEYARFDERRRQFRALNRATRERLKAIYDVPRPLEEKARLKREAMDEYRRNWEKLKASWPGDPARYRGYDQLVARANNAIFGAQAAYDELVPGFEALFHRSGDDWKRFYDAVKRLAKLPEEQRHELLKKETAGG